jgi:hypothetical protein
MVHGKNLNHAQLRRHLRLAEVAGTEQLVTNKVYASAAMTKDEAKGMPKIATVDGIIANRFLLPA